MALITQKVSPRNVTIKIVIAMKKEMRFGMLECRVGKRITTKAKGHKGMLEIPLFFSKVF